MILPQGITDQREIWEYYRLTKTDEGKMIETFVTISFNDEDMCTPYRARRRKALATWNGRSWTISPKLTEEEKAKLVDPCLKTVLHDILGTTHGK